MRDMVASTDKIKVIFIDQWFKRLF
jgi:hypothetical protein